MIADIVPADRPDANRRRVFDSAAATWSERPALRHDWRRAGERALGYSDEVVIAPQNHQLAASCACRGPTAPSRRHSTFDRCGPPERCAPSAAGGGLA